MTMSVPASKTSLDTLLAVLSTGTVITSFRDDLLDVTETAACLGIQLTDIQIGVKNDKSLEEEKEKVENGEKKVSKRGRKKKIETEKKNAKNGKKNNGFNDATKEVESNKQESQQPALDENFVEDASGPKEEIKLTNEKQESEQSDAETEVINDIEDTRLAALSTGTVLTNSGMIFLMSRKQQLALE